MKKLILILLVCLLSVNTYADEVITEFSEETLPVLNEELRKIKSNIRNFSDTDTDEKSKVSSNDTTAGYLNGKLVAGTNITLTENNDGGDETLTIATSSSYLANRRLFTSSGTFTAPTGVTKVYITMCGAGGGGGGGVAGKGGGGGGGGEAVIKFPYAVTGGNNYSVTIGAAGSGGAVSTTGGNGGYSQWVNSSYRMSGGMGGLGGAGGAGGAGAAANTTDGNTNGTAGQFYSIGGGTGGDGSLLGGQGGGGGGSAFGFGGVGGANANGGVATNYGGAGGGGGGAHTGGAGTAGMCLIEY